jgi:hypothetical protein
VSISDITNPGTDPTNATELDKLQVTVSIPFSSVRWLALYQVTTSSGQISACGVFGIVCAAKKAQSTQALGLNVSCLRRFSDTGVAEGTEPEYRCGGRLSRVFPNQRCARLEDGLQENALGVLDAGPRKP